MMPFVFQLVEDSKYCAKSIALYDCAVQAANRAQKKIALAEVVAFL